VNTKTSKPPRAKPKAAESPPPAVKSLVCSNETCRRVKSADDRSKWPRIKKRIVCPACKEAAPLTVTTKVPVVEWLVQGEPIKGPFPDGKKRWELHAVPRRSATRIDPATKRVVKEYQECPVTEAWKGHCRLAGELMNCIAVTVATLLPPRRHEQSFADWRVEAHAALAKVGAMSRGGAGKDLYFYQLIKDYFADDVAAQAVFAGMSSSQTELALAVKTRITDDLCAAYFEKTKSPVSFKRYQPWPYGTKALQANDGAVRRDWRPAAAGSKSAFLVRCPAPGGVVYWAVLSTKHDFARQHRALATLADAPDPETPGVYGSATVEPVFVRGRERVVRSFAVSVSTKVTPVGPRADVVPGRHLQIQTCPNALFVTDVCNAAGVEPGFKSKRWHWRDLRGRICRYDRRVSELREDNRNCHARGERWTTGERTKRWADRENDWMRSQIQMIAAALVKQARLLRVGEVVYCRVTDADDQPVRAFDDQDALSRQFLPRFSWHDLEKTLAGQFKRNSIVFRTVTAGELTAGPVGRQAA
jgi:hypothetical protein